MCCQNYKVSSNHLLVVALLNTVAWETSVDHQGKWQLATLQFS